MNPNQRSQLVLTLQQHQKIARQVLDLIETESAALSAGAEALPLETARRKRELLPQLNQCMLQLKGMRQTWQQLPTTEREMDPALRSMIRATQDLLLKVIVRDRENEQLLLQKGQVPASQLKQVRHVRPHYAASVYQRAGMP